MAVYAAVANAPEVQALSNADVEFIDRLVEGKADGAQARAVSSASQIGEAIRTLWAADNYLQRLASRKLGETFRVTDANQHLFDEADKEGRFVRVKSAFHLTPELKRNVNSDAFDIVNTPLGRVTMASVLWQQLSASAKSRA